VVDVAESRESERDMATEAGAKVEGRMLEVGEEKKCIVALAGWVFGGGALDGRTSDICGMPARPECMG
jgi:hypothetical protein